MEAAVETEKKPEIFLTFPTGQGCVSCGGPVYMGIMSHNGKAQKVKACSWCKTLHETSG